MALISEGILTTFLKGLSFMDFYKTLPFHWNRESSKLELKSGGNLLFGQILLAFGSLSVVISSMQIILTWHQASTTARIYSLMSTSVSVMGVFSSYASYRCPYQTSSLFNWMISHEQRWYSLQAKNEGKLFHISFPKMDIDTDTHHHDHDHDGKTKTKTGYGKLLKISLLMLATSSHSLLPPFMLSILVNPCFPTYYGFWIVSECHQGHLGQAPKRILHELGGKSVVLGVAFLNWIVFLPALHFQCCMIMYQGYGFRSYIDQNLRNILKSTKLIRTKLISLPFREIQLMINLHREINSKFVLLSLLICGIFAQTTGLYSCISVISGRSQMEAQMLFFCFSTAFLSFIVFTVGYGFLAQVHRISKKSKAKCLSAVGLMRNGWFRRYIKSCPILKVYFGSQNFLESLTTLNIEQFVVNLTIDLLLVKTK